MLPFEIMAPILKSYNRPWLLVAYTSTAAAADDNDDDNDDAPADLLH